MLNFVDMGAGVIILGIAITFISVTIYYQWHKNRDRGGVVWEDNDYYVSEGSENHSKCQIDIDDAFMIHNHHMLPGWLKKKKEIIFLQRSIKKGEMIGSGQFGAVFKGTLNLGNAVYVFVFLLT